MLEYFAYLLIKAAFLPDVLAPLHSNHLRNCTTLHISIDSRGILAPGMSSSVRNTFSLAGLFEGSQVADAIL